MNRLHRSKRDSRKKREKREFLTQVLMLASLHVSRLISVACGNNGKKRAWTAGLYRRNNGKKLLAGNFRKIVYIYIHKQ
jgi:hypothetical protein